MFGGKGNTNLFNCSRDVKRLCCLTSSSSSLDMHTFNTNAWVYLYPPPPPTTTRPSSRLVYPNLTIFSSSSNSKSPPQVYKASFRAEQETENRKHELLRAIQETQRGIATSEEKKCSIEEALVSVESCDAGTPLDLDVLNGTWRLQYTSAPDVLVLLDAALRLPFFQVGQIFQKFECQAQSSGGYVRNIVRWSIPRLLEEEEGATLLVSAKFSVVSSRNIFLQFEEVTIKNINISEEVQALIAPAILPRTFYSLQLLQFIRTFQAQYPVGNQERQSPGGLYYISYLDGNILLGRAVTGGGVFVFTRAHTVV